MKKRETVFTTDEMQLLLWLVRGLDPARYESDAAKALIHKTRTLSQGDHMRFLVDPA